MMAGMLGLSVSTALLGFQWRRQRTMGDEIADLKKQIPSFEGSDLKSAIAAAKEAGDQAQAIRLEGALAVDAQIQELSAERKELSTAKPRDKHFSQGALLACLGTLFAIEVRSRGTIKIPSCSNFLHRVH